MTTATSIFNHTELELLESLGFKIGSSGYFELEKDSIYTMVVKGPENNPFIYLYETRFEISEDNTHLRETTISKTLWDYRNESLIDFFKSQRKIIENS